MTIGIICEYNPFHNGHLYHIEKIKEKYPNSTIVLVMSGNFVQRGNISIINKWNKTSIALNHKVDLVIELPFKYASQSADIFALGAISILKELKVDKLIFGSESNDVEKLYEFAKIQLNDKRYDIKVSEYLDKGENYPTAMSKALKDLTKTSITEPNDLLGLSYIKEIIRQKANIEVETIKRTNDFHSRELDNDITSATSIREALKRNINIEKYVPNDVMEYLDDNYNLYQNNYFNYLKYKIISEGININTYQTVDEGIENRVLKYIDESNSLDELIKLIKTKRYTYNKLSRMFNHIITSFTKEEASNRNLEYIRLLGFNKKGREYLNSIKKELTVPLITKQEKEYNTLLTIDNRIDKIYKLITDNKDNEKIIKY